MSNMSYCRFRNTLADLRDCYDNMNDIDLSEESDGNDEIAARQRLIDLCCDIALAYGDEIGRELQEVDDD